MGLSTRVLDWLWHLWSSTGLDYWLLKWEKSVYSWKYNSDTMPVSVGIPQRSVLGPKLLSLFTNDLPSSVKSGSLFLVADDTTIYCIKRTTDEAVAQLDKAVGEFYDWCFLNRLTPHPEKSEAMLICKTRDRGSVALIHIGTVAIEWVNKSRLLGTTVDHKLSWVPHMLDLKKRVSQRSET